MHETDLSGGQAWADASMRIAFVQSEWHGALVELSRDAFLDEIVWLGFDAGRVDLFRVPGAFEIPLHAKRLVGTGHYAAVVVAGLVIDGGIYRHQFVAKAVINGPMRVQLDADVPVLSAVLTPHHFHESDEHTVYLAFHLAVNGAGAARVCARTLHSLTSVPAQAA
jgi:6,7-dimethyl-8-ribityllumazine synthase